MRITILVTYYALFLARTANVWAFNSGISSIGAKYDSKHSNLLYADFKYQYQLQRNDFVDAGNSAKKARQTLQMGIFRFGGSGHGFCRPKIMCSKQRCNRFHIRGLGSRAVSITNRVFSSTKLISRSAKRRFREVLIHQKQKALPMLASVALAFFMICGSASSTRSSLMSQNNNNALQPESNHQVRIVPYKPLQVCGGGRTGSHIIKSSRFEIFNSNQNALHKHSLAAVLPKSSKSNVNNNGHGMAVIDDVTRQTTRTFRTALNDLRKFMTGPKSDTILLLLATALITPICIQLGTSPILGFLFAGMLLGPNGWGLISGIHTTETLAELGIVFFLFEMGIELSVERLMSMKKDVFGLGLLQFTATALAVAGIGGSFTSLSGAALVVLGGGLALSSSAFVLQLLKDKDQLATRFGRASFGVLLFQDLAVVPLLVVTPILAGGGKGLAAALGNALVKASMALGSIAFAGRVVLNPLFKLVAQANSQEAFLGLILLTVLSMSFMTEGLGLSNTLGAFLAGVLLSETKYRYQVEADIAPFRGVLLGLFFVTVGFEIDLQLIASTFPLIPAIALGIVAIKATILTLLSLFFKLSFANAQQTGLILSQGGEFAFVAFALARGLGIFDDYTTKVLLTSISLTMALTPFLTETGSKAAKKLAEEKSDFSHYLGQDQDAIEIKESDDFVAVIGYGVVGKVVCDLLDRKFVKYVGLEIDPNKAIEARNRGLPVFYGDIGRSEVSEAFNIGNAKAVIVTIASKPEINRAVTRLRRLYPDVKIFARAVDAEHAQRLQSNLDVAAMVPILPEDNVLLTLPFGGAVLKALGAPAEEVNAILEAKRKEVLSGRGLTVNEEETVLLQLGITTEQAEASSKESSQSSPSKSHGGVTEQPEKNPMVAQVIEANTTPKELEKDNDDMIDAVDDSSDDGDGKEKIPQ